MTTFLLIRHASTAVLGHRITGRLPGVTLSPEGRSELRWLADALSGLTLAAVCSSPLERARQTAEALAVPRGLEVKLVPGIEEVDYGEWSGRTLEELAGDPRWVRYNRYRSAAPIPGGETAYALQARAVAAVEELHRRFGDATVAVVSHSDVIKAVLAFYLGVPLDLALRLEVDPASVSTLVLEEWSPRILGVNRPPFSIPRPPETEELR